MPRPSALALAFLLATAPAGPQALAGPGQVDVGIYSLTQLRGHPYKGSGPPHIYVHSALFDGLTVIAAGGEPRPNLALSWSNPAPDRWRFELRPGVVFSNGEPFDAAAVKASFDWLLGPAGQATWAGNVADIVTSVAVVAPLTVEFTTSRPDPTFPNRIAGVFIVAPGAWATRGEDGFALEPAGTGPYRVKSWRPGEAVLEAWEGSWRKAATQSLRFVELPEETARVQAIQSGQIDLSLPVSPDSFPAVEMAGGSVFRQVAPTVMSLALIEEKADSPFRDVRVRQAMNLAVDKEIIAEVLLAGTSRAASQPVTAVAAGHDPDLAPWPYDPDRARALLAEAGYPDGFRFVGEVVVGSLPADADIYAKVAQDLADIGVKAEFRTMTFPDWLRKFFAGNWEGDAFGMSYFATPAMTAVNALTNYSCAKSPPPAHICLEGMMDAYRAAEGTFDPAEREVRMRALMRMAHEQALSLFLVDGVDLVGLAPGVGGYTPLIRWIPWEQVTVKE